jgi:hypothetical protein
MTIGTWKWQGCQPYGPAAFTPRKQEVLCQWKILTPKGIDPANFRFVGKCLNHCATACPNYLVITYEKAAVTCCTFSLRYQPDSRIDPWPTNVIYIYGAPCKARNFNVVSIWTSVWQRWKPSLSICCTMFQHWINADSFPVSQLCVNTLPATKSTLITDGI